MAHQRPQNDNFEAKSETKIAKSTLTIAKKNKIDKETPPYLMGGSPPMGFARVSLSISICFCYGKGAVSYFLICLFEIVILGPPVSHFSFVFASEHVFGGKNIIC